MMAAIVAPAGARNIAMMRACFVSGRLSAFEVGFEARPRRGFDLFPARADFLVDVLGFDLALVIEGSPRLYATPAAAPPQPCRAKLYRQGPVPKRAKAALSHRSNAPTRPKSQSFLSKKVARPRFYRQLESPLPCQQVCYKPRDALQRPNLAKIPEFEGFRKASFLGREFLAS
jgi:hypothetical protein